MHYWGELIAVLVAFSWTISALCFEYAGNRIGSLSVNLWRLFFSFALLGGFLLMTTGSILPTQADGRTWLWMSLSGAVGFVFGDLCLFHAYTLITARFSQLLMTLAPPFAALFGWMLLGESLSLMAGLGMTVTLFGIAISVTRRDRGQASKDALVCGGSNLTVVVPEKPAGRTGLSMKIPMRGILIGIGGALGQGLGIVLSKKGMLFYEPAAAGSAVAEYIPFAATQIRVITGIAGFMLIIALSGRTRSFIGALRNRKAMGTVFSGSIFGPFLGVSGSLMAVQYTGTAVASTIMATTPIIILLPHILLYKKKVTRAEALGAIISVIGVSLFFL